MQRSPRAHILCGAGDIDALRGATGILADAVTCLDTVLGLDVVPTPGHTPGHLRLFDEYSSTMLLGDVAGNIARPAAHPGRVAAPTRFRSPDILTTAPRAASRVFRVLSDRAPRAVRRGRRFGDRRPSLPRSPVCGRPG